MYKFLRPSTRESPWEATVRSLLSESHRDLSSKAGRQEDRETRRQEDTRTGRQEERKTCRQEDTKTGRHLLPRCRERRKVCRVVCWDDPDEAHKLERLGPAMKVSADYTRCWSPDICSDFGPLVSLGFVKLRLAFVTIFWSSMVQQVDQSTKKITTVIKMH